jgi:Cu/Ag efflux pump CusA
LLDPLLILLAVPTGLTGVLLILFFTGTTVNVMSLMGVVMMVGIVVSNSILIIDFMRRLRCQERHSPPARDHDCQLGIFQAGAVGLGVLVDAAYSLGARYVLARSLPPRRCPHRGRLRLTWAANLTLRL